MTAGDHVVVTGGMYSCFTGVVSGTQTYRYGDRDEHFVIVRFADGRVSHFHRSLLAYAAVA